MGIPGGEALGAVQSVPAHAQPSPNEGRLRVCVRNERTVRRRRPQRFLFFSAREKSSAREAGDRYAKAAVRGEDEREREEQGEEMNTFDVQDPSEEPGYPTQATTPRSIRN